MPILLFNDQLTRVQGVYVPLYKGRTNGDAHNASALAIKARALLVQPGRMTQQRWGLQIKHAVKPSM